MWLGFIGAFANFADPEVVDCTRKLIDTCAPGGGFMIDTSAPVDDAKPENFMAMFETVETYGRRRERMDARWRQITRL